MARHKKEDSAEQVDEDPEARARQVCLTLLTFAPRTRVKVVKNKLSPPFRTAEFDILYGIGISREGSLIDLGVEHGIVRKAGAWYTYDGDQLGQGKENSRKFLLENPAIALDIEQKIMFKLGVGAEAKAAQATAAADALQAQALLVPKGADAKAAKEPTGRSEERRVGKECVP